ncbi:protein-glutamine gamma-glutamyltransferase [Comamonadaceae bacterium OS-1]|nr:protein-glutamine gamma-glutamyltransferase [Comamonadaceae bacterium OS-1]
MLNHSARLGRLPHLPHLPRDSRDTLFLLAVIAWVVLPQIGNLPVWCALATAGVLVWRGWLAWGSRPLPSRWWLAVLLGAALAATLATHKTLLGRDAGVTLIVVLLALKTLELRARRDAFVVFFLGFFTMLSNFFFSQSLLTAVAMLVALLGLLTALVNAHMPVENKAPLREAARIAGGMALLGAPIMAVLFVLFPRVAPLWGVPSDAMAGRSGLSASMQVGTMASLALDDSIAMRVRFDGPPPAQRDLYFRGPVLSLYDGREWLPQARDFARPAARDLQVSGPPVRYQVTLEPNNRPWLLALEATPQAPTLPAGVSAVMTTDLQWLSSHPTTELLRYQAQSYPQFRYGPQRANLDLQRYVDLPPGFNPRTLQLAADLRRAQPAADTAALVQTVLTRLRNGGYLYTLEPGLYGRDTADEFWFDRKAGFCEHIASSFVVLMRALDIPARVVTGYQGGELNGVDGFWVVRQSDAHAWAEVWTANTGWTRVDPTGAVSPGRVGSFTRLQAPRGAIANTLANVSPDTARRLRAAWDALNNGWNQWVLNYSQSQQLNLLKNIGFDSPEWEDLGKLLAGLLVLASLGGAVWAQWERRQHDPWLRLLEQARRKLAKAGITVPPSAAPRQMAALVADRPDLHDWLLQMEGLRYAPHSPDSLAALRRAWAQIRK